MDDGIRVATTDDAAAIADIYRLYVEESAISFEHVAPGPVRMVERIERTLQTYPWLVFDEGEVLGYAYASPFGDREAYRWSATVSVYVRQGFARKGIGRRLLAPLLEVLERQGHVAAFAGITLPNPSSVGLFESFGFEPVGVQRGVGFKAGAWRDVGWWQRDLGSRPARPERPVPFAALSL